LSNINIINDTPQEYGAVYIAFSPLGGRRSQPAGQNPIITNPVLTSIGEKHGLTAAQVNFYMTVIIIHKRR